MKGVSVFSHRLKDGRQSWGYRFDTAPINGKRQQTSKSGYKTKTAALRAGLEALQQYENLGRVVNQSRMSYSDFLDIWIKDCTIDLKSSTLDNYKKKIRNHIKPALGSYPLIAIQRETIQEFINNMFNNGYAYNTLSVVKGIVTKSFNYAVDNNYLKYSPAVRLRIPANKVPETPTRINEHHILADETAKQIFNKYPEGSPYHIPLRLGYECGLRIGEAYALVWEDIDFENHTITINRQIQWQEDSARSKEQKKQDNGKADCGAGHWYFTTPKYKSYRTIKISDSLTELLRRERERQIENRGRYGEYYYTYFAKYPLSFNCKSTSGDIKNPVSETAGSLVNFVCVRENGSYTTSRTFQHAARMIKRDIVKNFSFHDLRETHATRLYEAGLPTKYISARLGHKDEQITRRVYIKLTSDMQTAGDEQAVKVCEIFAQ